MQHLLRREETLDTTQLGDLAEQPQRAARLVLAAAANGEIEAQALLGQILLEGYGIQADPTLALTWFDIAAERGHAMACNMAGRCHEHGWGCTADTKRAADYYRRAADLGLDWGMYNLANLLATGRGVVKDHTTAYRLYRQAAELGHAKSMNLTGRCLEDGCGVARMSPRHTPGMHARPKPATSAGSSATLRYCWHKANGSRPAAGWSAPCGSAISGLSRPRWPACGPPHCRRSPISSRPTRDDAMSYAPGRGERKAE